MDLTSNLVVNGVTYSQSILSTITVTVVGGCVTTTITPPTMPLLVYQVNTPTITYNIPTWTESYGSCTPFTLSAYDSITLSLPSFITFSSPTLSITSTNDVDSGLYDI